MYVCLCKGITDKHIQQEIEKGAKRLKDVVKSLNLAKDCAQCVTLAREVFESATSQAQDAEFYSAMPAAGTAA